MKSIKKSKGFTLIEVVVAIAVFSILVAVGVGGFVNALRTQREVTSLIAAQSNASLAIEQMAREIRTGYLFCNTADNGGIPSICAPDSLGVDAQGQDSGCTFNGTSLTCNDILDFYNADGANVDYELINGVLQRSDTGPTGIFTPITGGNVTVNYLSFTLFGNTEGDHWNPRITISLGIVPTSNDPAVASDTVNLQTTISARAIDCKSSGINPC
jgi:prepilin-type N-terminal cleavage/methylation domain-containing protein